MTEQFSLRRQCFRHRSHRQVRPEESAEVGFFTENQPSNVGVQPVGADHDVEAAQRGVLECHIAVRRNTGDRVAEQILDILSAGVVVDLAEIVAHDLHVQVRGSGHDLCQVDTGRTLAGIPMNAHPIGAGGLRLDAPQHVHLAGDLHRRPEQVDGVATGLTQRRRAFHHGDRVTGPGQPVGQHRPGDAGARNQDSHSGSVSAVLTYR